jgi:purine-binding chemotaxis protein CheW
VTEARREEAVAGPRARARWDEIARDAARPPEPEVRSALRDFVGFRLDGAPYALPVERIREIARVGAVTPVPRVPAAVLGVVSLRGEMLQLIDLRRRLGLPPAARSRGQRILVVTAGESVAGLLVDAVTEVLRIAEPTLKAAPPGSSEFIWALHERGPEFVSLLDPERVVALGRDA